MNTVSNTHPHPTPDLPIIAYNDYDKKLHGCKKYTPHPPPLLQDVNRQPVTLQGPAQPSLQTCDPPPKVMAPCHPKITLALSLCSIQPRYSNCVSPPHTQAPCLHSFQDPTTQRPLLRQRLSSNEESPSSLNVPIGLCLLKHIYKHTDGEGGGNGRDSFFFFFN